MVTQHTQELVELLDQQFTLLLKDEKELGALGAEPAHEIPTSHEPSIEELRGYLSGKREVLSKVFSLVHKQNPETVTSIPASDIEILETGIIDLTSKITN